MWACYEAGPTGYKLARTLQGARIRCEVIAPSLIPTRPGDRVKTDRRDARRLAVLFRAGQLTAVGVPTPAKEAVRDLCRARADMVIDRTRARHRLGKFLPRHGRIWRGGHNWTLKHHAWINQQRFDDPTPTSRCARTEPRSPTPSLAWAPTEGSPNLARWPWHRRCATGGASRRRRCSWGFCGLVPSENSSGERTQRGGITHAGNGHLRTQLVESAWAHKSRPAAGVVLRRRQAWLDPTVVARAWTAQQRLSTKFGRLDAGKTNR